MKDINLKGLNDIKTEKELIERTVNKVMKNNISKKTFNVKKSVAMAASLFLIIGAVSSYPLYKGYLGAAANKPATIAVRDNVKTPIEGNEITIPAIELKSSGAGVQGKMMPLVVYKGKVYLMSTTQVAPEILKNFLGEKVGRSVGSIDEWNVGQKSSEEMASTIGEQDIYTVKGYDDNFRIMSYTESNGAAYGQFFDCLNGITVKSGKDILGKLNIVDNIESGKFIGFDDWNNGVVNYTEFKDLTILNEFSKELNNAVPYSLDTVGTEVEGSRNNDGFREITLKLKDGCEVKLSVFKNGYVSSGYSDIYFKVDSSVISKIWQ